MKTLYALAILAFLAAPAEASQATVRELVTASEEIAGSELPDDEKISRLENIRTQIVEIRKNESRKDIQRNPQMIKTEVEPDLAKNESGDDRFSIIRWLLWRTFGLACVAGIIAAGIALFSECWARIFESPRRNAAPSNGNGNLDLGKPFTSKKYDTAVAPPRTAAPLRAVPSSKSVPRDGTVPDHLR